jgi:diguanylate cyclase (GGDEF)-like protein/PAS domain S-box-containing protein
MRFGKRHAPPADAVAAAKSLFFGAAPLARSAGPAAIVREDGRVVAANGAAWKRTALLGLAEAAPLRREISSAIQKQRPETVPIVGDGVTLTIEVLPLEPGVALLLGHESGATDALNEALVDSRARYKALVELSSEFAWETGADGRFAFVSPKGALGYAAVELVGRDAASFCLAGGDSPPFVARSRVDNVTVWWRKKDGSEACLAVSAAPFEREGRWLGTRGICRDVTAERGYEDALARARQREDLIAYVVRLMRDAETPDAMLAGVCEATARSLAARSCRVYKVAANGDVEEAAKFGDGNGDGALTLLVTRAARGGRAGFAAMETETGRRIGRPTQHRQAVNGVLVLERAPGSPAWSEDDRTLIAGIADQLGIALAQAEAQAALERASRTDPLTGLLNRRAFESEMVARLGRQANVATPGALLLIDLDNFKQINDTAGHERGDEALKAVAEMLVCRTRPGDLVARLGGDEFALWLERVDAEVASSRAAQLVAAASELAAFSVASETPLGFSIGVALRRAGSDLAQLLSRADAAMYQAKRSGKGSFAFDKGHAKAANA